MQSVEGGGHDLVLGCFWQQVTCNLFHEKRIVGQVSVEGFDHPVAVGPDRAVYIALITIGVCVARCVQPWRGQVLSHAWRSQQSRHSFFLARGNRCCFEGIEFRQGRRQACQHQSGPPQPDCRADLVRDFMSCAFKALCNHLIDGVPLIRFSGSLFRQGSKGPVPGILGPCVDPFPQQLAFLW